MEDSTETKIIIMVVLCISIFISIFFLNPFVKIDAGERGVVKVWGAVQDDILGEGLHFRTPIVQQVVQVDVKTKIVEAQATSYSKDLQTAEAKLALNYHIQPELVNKLVQEIGMDYEERIIAPALQEVMKQISANYTATELISERAKVKTELKDALIVRLQPKYLSVDDISIVNFDFSDAYEAAIDAKQVAEQQAQKAENDLKRIQVEAQQQIETAKAQAESIRIQGEALKQNTGLVDLKAVEKWDGKLPTYMMGDSVPLVNIK